LIIDQKADKTKSNFGIRSLPNLETKFVAANTLIGLEKENNLFRTPEIKIKENEIKEINHNYFTANSRSKKIKLQQKSKILREELSNLLKSTGFPKSEAEKIAKLDLFDQNKSENWFDPEWMFGLTKGFDIVIGNPPYLKEGRVLKELFDCIRGTEYYQGKMDLWYAFSCYGIDFLKNNGHLCFIATNNWVTNSGASKMRNKIIEDSQIKQLVDFGSYMIFESADIQTMIMLFKKNRSNDDYNFDYRKLIGNDVNLQDVINILNKTSIKANYLTPTILRDKFKDKFLTFNDNDDIFEKILENAVYFKKNELSQGVVFPQDFLNKKNQDILGENFVIGEGIFALTEHEKNNLNFSEDELKLIKPYYTTEQIHRYLTEKENKLWLIYTSSRFKNLNSLNNYPKLKMHLDRFAKIITSDNKPYGIHRTRKEKYFIGEKIIATRKSVENPIFSYCDFDCYVSQTFNIIKTDKCNLKFLVGLLNSKLIAFWLKNKGKMQGDNFQLDTEPLMQIPIKIPEDQQPIITLVDKILSAKKENPQADTGAPEREIDKLVYELYDLSHEEIRIVEGN
jgi:hypothetical protein